MKRRRTLGRLLIAMVFAFAEVSAQIADVMPPPMWADELPGKGTLTKPVVGLTMGRTFVRFEKTTLHSILERSGGSATQPVVAPDPRKRLRAPARAGEL
jgi:hypothetical protein